MVQGVGRRTTSCRGYNWAGPVRALGWQGRRGGEGRGGLRHPARKWYGQASVARIGVGKVHGGGDGASLGLGQAWVQAVRVPVGTAVKQLLQIAWSSAVGNSTKTWVLRGKLTRTVTSFLGMQRSVQHNILPAAPLTPLPHLLARPPVTPRQVGPETNTDMGHFLLCGPGQLHDLHSKLQLDHPQGTANQLHKCIVSHASGRGVFDGNVQVGCGVDAVMRGSGCVSADWGVQVKAGVLHVCWAVGYSLLPFTPAKR